MEEERVSASSAVDFEPPSQERTVACRIAGITVAALVLDIPIRYVTLRRDSALGAEGSVVRAMPRASEKTARGAALWRQRGRRIDEGTIRLAGVVAECRCKREDPTESALGWQRRNVCYDLGRDVGSAKELESLADWLTIRATNLIDSHWQQVVAVAEALVQRQHLSREEVKAVLQAVGHEQSLATHSPSAPPSTGINPPPLPLSPDAFAEEDEVIFAKGTVRRSTEYGTIFRGAWRDCGKCHGWWRYVIGGVYGVSVWRCLECGTVNGSRTG